MLTEKFQREEIWNAASHGLAFLMGLVFLPILVVQSVRHGGTYEIVGSTIFGVTLVIAMGASMVYHASRNPKKRRIFRIIDHASIFLLIAGSYTPICLTTLRGPWGWSLFGVVWGVAIIGIVLKCYYTGRYDFISTMLYLAMGWVCLVAIVPMVRLLQGETLAFLVIGGLAFTSGVPFYLKDYRSGYHFTWHLFVMVGCACLYAAVFSELWA